MIYHNGKQVGFIYKGNKLIEKIYKNGKLYYEKGFLRETIGASPLTIKGVGLPLKNYEVFGNTTQETTTGKNLLGIIDFTKSATDVTIVGKDNEITINGTVATNRSIDLTDLIKINLSGNYTLSLFQEGSISGSNTRIYVKTDTEEISATNSIPVTKKALNSTLDHLTIWLNKGTIFTDYKIKLQLEQGSTATSFEPYTGAQPSPNPDYPQEIESVGDLVTDTTDENYGKYKIPVNVQSENLYKSNTFLYNSTSAKVTRTNNGVLVNGQKTTDKTEVRLLGTYNRTTPVIPLESGKNYIVSTTSKYLIIDDVNIADGTSYYSKSNKSFTIIGDNWGISSIKLKLLEGHTFDNEEVCIMINEGSTAKPYQPYYNTTTNIYLSAPLRKIGDYADYVDFKDGKVVRNIGEVVLDGNEDWQNSNKSFSVIPVILPQKPLNNDTKGKGISSHYIISTYNDGYNGKKDYCFGISALSSRFNFRNKDITLLEDFKTWLSNNNVEVQYILNEPTEETITLPSILTTNGTNNITIDTKTPPSNIYLKYKSEV